MSRPSTNCIRSRSWVARSIATPVSWMRAGSGPTRGGVGAEDATDAALVDQLGELANGGVEALDVADHELHGRRGARRRPSAARPPARWRWASRRTRACLRRCASSAIAGVLGGGRRRCRRRRRRRAPAASGSRRPSRSGGGRCARARRTRRARRRRAGARLRHAPRSRRGRRPCARRRSVRCPAHPQCAFGSHPRRRVNRTEVVGAGRRAGGRAAIQRVQCQRRSGERAHARASTPAPAASETASPPSGVLSPKKLTTTSAMRCAACRRRRSGGR